MRWREREGVRWLEAELPGARAAFTTRLGGQSAGPFASLNLGTATGDDLAAVLANRRRLCERIERDWAGVVIASQVHGAEILEHRRRQPQGFLAEPSGAEPSPGDGHRTPEAELTPLVLVADCLPIALAGENGVAMIHAGWRGLAVGIVERAVEGFDGVSAAAVGPGIGRCCYEVGPEVLEAFASLGDGVADGRRLDLAEVAVRLLKRAGVSAVEVAGRCTSCEPELFFSHRRDGARTGRQAGLAWRIA